MMNEENKHIIAILQCLENIEPILERIDKKSRMGPAYKRACQSPGTRQRELGKDKPLGAGTHTRESPDVGYRYRAGYHNYQYRCGDDCSKSDFHNTKTGGDP
jgi:hypothetical protein